MKAVIPALTFAVRHLLFVVFVMFTGCLLWTAAYLLLLVVAMLGNHGLGGPLAYPAGIIAILATCAFLGWGVFAPASAIGAIFCGLLKLPRIAAIPVVCASALLLYFLVSLAYTGLVTIHPLPSGWEVLKNFTIFLSIPLGIYWWLTEGPGALFDVFRRWFKKRRSNRALSASEWR